MHWFGVTAAQTLTKVTETHKQTDHMNQQGLAGRVMIKQAQSHLQFLLNSVFFSHRHQKGIVIRGVKLAAPHCRRPATRLKLRGDGGPHVRANLPPEQKSGGKIGVRGKFCSL